MPVAPCSIAIVGCGSAGPAAGTLLARAGHRVTLFEQAADIAPVGAGLLVQPAGQAVLRRLGLLEEVLAHSAPIRRLAGTNSRGREVIDLRYADLDPRLCGLGVHRALLLHLLLGAFKAAGGELRCGHPVTRLERDPVRRWKVVEEDADVHGPYDLLILSDGARSRLREAAGLPLRQAKAYPWGALWAIVPDRERLYPDVLQQRYEGTRLFLGIMPTGTCLTTGEPLVSLFWSLRNDAYEALVAGGFEAWRAEVLRLEPRCAPIVAELEARGGFEALMHARYMDVVMRPWHGDRLLCIGDAAHAMGPQLGQGVNLALQDAAAVADALATSDGLPAALARYSAARKRQLGFYQFATRWATTFFQSDHGALAFVRDALFGPFGRTPGLRGQFLRILVGVKRGFLRPSLPLDELPSIPQSPDPTPTPKDPENPPRQSYPEEST